MQLVRSALVALAFMLAAAACGSASADDTEVEIRSVADVKIPVPDELPASVDESEPELVEPALEEPEVEKTFADAALDFAVCMRSEGVANWPDPSPGSTGGSPFADTDFEALGIDPTSQDVRDTISICRGEFEGVPNPRDSLSPEEEAERRDTEVAMAECIRGNAGFEDFPDPDPVDGGFEHVRDAVLRGEISFVELRPVLQDCASQLGIELPNGG